MKRRPRVDPAFRIALTLLVATSLLLLIWQCSGRPPGPSRLDWSPSRSHPP